jgi:hypothetical protein
MGGRGVPVAVAAFERGARALAGMIASVAAAAEITTVVVGGGVSAAGEVLFEPLERALDDVAGLPFVRAVQVRQSTLGVRASLAGAAKLAYDSGGSQPAGERDDLDHSAAEVGADEGEHQKHDGAGGEAVHSDEGLQDRFEQGRLRVLG